MNPAQKSVRIFGRHLKRSALIAATIFLTIVSTSADSNAVHSINILSEAALDTGSLPFAEVVFATTGHKIVVLDTNNTSHAQLCAAIVHAADLVMANVQSSPIEAARPNEAGTRIDKYVRTALEKVGLNAGTPTNTEGRAQSTGYPDIEISSTPHCYLELKTYSESAKTSSQRTFYYSPSETPKVTQDALHLLLAFQLERDVRTNGIIFKPTHWQLISLENLRVRMKLEFNQSNRGLYGPDKAMIILGEGQLGDGSR